MEKLLTIKISTVIENSKRVLPYSGDFINVVANDKTVFFINQDNDIVCKRDIIGSKKKTVIDLMINLKLEMTDRMKGGGWYLHSDKFSIALMFNDIAFDSDNYRYVSGAAYGSKKPFVRVDIDRVNDVESFYVDDSILEKDPVYNF